MKSFCLVSLFATCSLLLVAFANPVARANQLNASHRAQEPHLAGTTQEAPAPLVPIFGRSVAYDSGATSSGPVVVADVNDDGKPDVVVGNAGSSTVSVLKGNGDGTFQSPVRYNVGEQVESIAIKDVNGDGKLDIVVATYVEAGNPNSGGVAVLIGRGDGTFQPVVTYSSGGYAAMWVAVTDVNDDGHPDLIVVNACPNYADCNNAPASAVGVLLGNGDGTFQPPIVSSTPRTTTQWPAVGDLNGDGKTDLALPLNSGLGVLLGNGDGTFQSPVIYSPGGYAGPVAIGDVNGDGKPDLVEGVYCTPMCGSTAVGVLLGNGDGTFQPPVLSSLDINDVFESIAIEDLEGDGKPDVVIATYGAGLVLLGNGDGTFQESAEYVTGLKNAWATVADLNADGKPDLVMANTCGRCKAPDFNLQVRLNTLDALTYTTLTSSPNPALVNQSVTFTATVGSIPSIPDGEVVTFSIGKNNLGTGTTKNGVANFTTSFSKAKQYTIRATYPGDLYHKHSLRTVKQVVNP
jgi:FG-GAP-like repeat/Bacterial Ig-like domain (group 3)